ncbi:MAG: ABC transporter substrate-binding protein [Acidimicrobiales bacterium]
MGASPTLGARVATTLRATVAALAAVAILGTVVACSSSSDQATTSSSASGGGSTDTSPDRIKPVTGDPKPGGTLVFGLEAETDGWNPTTNRWAASGTQVALAVFDPLVAFDDQFNPTPYLAESFTPSNNYTVWDFKLRPNVKFHDGSPLNAAAVVKTVQAFKASPLTGAAARPIEKVEAVDDLTVRYTMAMPWATFPTGLTGQAGVVAAPAQLDSPDSTQKPIGTGPFTFQSWTPDKDLVVKKNASYWRKDSAGRQLPYLDGITFKPITETESRFSAVKSGEVNITVTSAEQTIIRMQEEAKKGGIQLVLSRGQKDVNLVLLNTTAAPMDDLRIRQAMAYAIDRETLRQVSQTDPALTANSVFETSSKWYKDTGYPGYDPAKAKSLVDSYVAEKGPVKFVFGSPPDPVTMQSVQLLQSQWQAVGMEVEIQNFDQNTFILNAVSGKFQAQIWRQFGAGDPDNNYIWWVSSNAEGNLALNMARNKDPELDKALNDGRATTDFPARKAAYDKVQERQTADLPYLWLSQQRWAAAASNQVRNFNGTELPNGARSPGVTNGVVGLTSVWLDT